jgi:type IV secretory pathway TrbD component
MAKLTPTFQCLSQPILVMGCERAPGVLVCGATCLCLVLAYFSWSLIALAATAFLFGAGIPTLQYLARRDPILIQVAARYSRYQRHYDARQAWTPDTSKRDRAIIAGTILLVAVAFVWWFFL